VLSRKVLLEEENAEKEEVHPGDAARARCCARGEEHHRLRRFIDLGGIDGLLHITTCRGAASATRPRSQGQRQVDVVVLKYDPATERVSLGHKQLVADPWSQRHDRYRSAARLRQGRESDRLRRFIELEAGVEGLIHVSEMTWSKRVKHPSKILNQGDPVEAMVLGVDPAARRISLGLKQIESNPWHDSPRSTPSAAHRRQGAQPDRVRRVRGGGGGHRRPHHISDMS